MLKICRESITEITLKYLCSLKEHVQQSSELYLDFSLSFEYEDTGSKELLFRGSDMTHLFMFKVTAGPVFHSWSPTVGCYDREGIRPHLSFLLQQASCLLALQAHTLLYRKREGNKEGVGGGLVKFTQSHTRTHFTDTNMDGHTHIPMTSIAQMVMRFR